MSVPRSDGDQAFRDLGRWLAARRPLWSERPFVGLPLSWEAAEPEVAAFLRSLPAAAVDAWERDPAGLPGAPEPYRRLATEAAAWSRRSALRCAGPARPAPDAQPDHVPARKWAQVLPFARLAARRAPAGVDRWVDWCCGKGHLGRTLAAATGLPFAGVERDESLCRAGATLAVAAGVHGRFVVADALADDVGDLLGPGAGVVALHACGGLHERLLRLADAGGASFLVLAPCCYHRHPACPPRPMSVAGRAQGLTLDAANLRLVGLREVVASPRRTALRRREQIFRLALDDIVREVTGEDRYRPTGSATRALADGPLEGFCRALASRVGVTLPAAVDWAALEDRAVERHRVVRALAFVRGLFRAPLEEWLLRDRAAFLAERGWHVEVGAFCDDVATPRNAAIVACREPWDALTVDTGVAGL